MADILEIHEFFAEGSNQERSHVLLHITEPGTPAEKAKGYFFALCEINNGPLEQIENLQQMIDDLESSYYESNNDEQEGNNFENLIERINHRGHHILQYNDTVINCIVGVIRGHELSLAYHGKPEAWLFYKGKEVLEQMDIIGEQQDKEGQLFPSILQGQLNTGDFFYIATPHVTDYFDPDRVNKILLTRNSRQSAEHVEKVLKDLNSELSFGGIFFHCPTEQNIPKTGKTPIRLDQESSAESLNKMVNREKSTAEIMSPPVLSGFNKKMNEWKKQRNEEKKLANEKGRIETNIRNHDIPTKESIINIILISLGKALVWGLVSLWRLLKNIFVFSGRILVVLFIIITNRNRQRKEIFKSFHFWWYSQKTKFFEMPLFSKIILILTILLGLTFIGSIATFKIKADYAAKKQVYNNQIQAIIDKKNSAEGSLLYGDENRALTLVKEAKEILTSLPEEDTKRQELEKEISTLSQRLQKINNITAELIVDLNKSSSLAKTEKLAAIDNFLIAYGKDDKLFYKIDPISKTAESREHLGFLTLNNSFTPKENDTIIFAADDSMLAGYSKDSGTLIKKDVIFPRDNVKISTISIYNRKLYAIDVNNNQIYKHSPTQTGYDKGSEWLKEEIDVRDAISMAIDGDAFILKSNGEILKLTAGAKQEFSISNLEPQLNQPISIWTHSSANNIYILEPTNKRIVALDKAGKLVGQYTSELWTYPTSMIIDEAKKTAYVLDNNKLYKFGL